MNISDRELLLQLTVGMQEIIRMFNKEYSKIVGFTINSDYSQNEIYQTCLLMHTIVMNYGNQNSRLNGYLNELKYYLLFNIKLYNSIDEYIAYINLGEMNDLQDSHPV